MTKAKLMEFVGKNVTVYFKHDEKGLYGTLGYVDEFSENMIIVSQTIFYIGHVSFKASHIRKVEVLK